MGVVVSVRVRVVKRSGVFGWLFGLVGTLGIPAGPVETRVSSVWSALLRADGWLVESLECCVGGGVDVG